MNFKVGDWVSYDNGFKDILFQIKEFDGEGSIKHANKKIKEEYLKLWKPSKGEWMWINTRADSLPFIACLVTQIKVDSTLVFTDYSYTAKGKRQDVLIHPDELISLEPFIGNLPSYIKDTYGTTIHT